MSEIAPLSIFKRAWLAFVCFFRILFRPTFAADIQNLFPGSKPPGGAAPTPSPTLPEQSHASGLFLLSMLQREGRFLDFLEEDVTRFSDAEVGAASRVVHEGCSRVARQYLSLKPVLSEPEGSAVTVPLGFDAQRIRLTGQILGQPPFKGSVKHHGWMTAEVKLPDVPTSLDLKVLAPAEVEL